MFWRILLVVAIMSLATSFQVSCGQTAQKQDWQMQPTTDSEVGCIDDCLDDIPQITQEEN